MVGIYKITNQINGKVYIGQSIDIKRRWYDHKRFSSYLETALYYAIRKYGIENFKFEIIEECSVQELDEKEIYWIKKYDTFKNGYNETEGGSGTKGSGLILNHDDVIKILKLLKETTLSEKEIANNFHVSQNIISRINTRKSWTQEGIVYPIRKLEKRFCKKCGIKVNNKDSYCKKCYDALREAVRNYNRPNREELKKLIRTKSFLEIGRMYNVSDNAIRKWCDSENLPRRKKEINSYSDEEWEKI